MDDDDDMSLRPKASQETFISMLNLDPTPMEGFPEEEEPTSEEQQQQPPQQRHYGQGASSLGLSGSGHGAVYFRTPCWPLSSLHSR